MIRIHITVELVKVSLPRMRGDDPAAMGIAGIGGKFAPHARG